MQLLRTGCQDLVKLKEVCAYHEKPVPTEIKMIYDVASGKFDTNYRYDEICSLKTGKGQSEVFMDWVAEMKLLKVYLDEQARDLPDELHTRMEILSV